MNYNTYICYDLETTGPNPHYDYPIEIAAIPLNPRTLKTEKDNFGKDITFYSLVKPPKAILDAAEADPEKKKSLEGALAINNKTLEELEDAPELSIVWSNFINFVHSYSSKPSDAWRLPIPVTYNGNGFDNVMINRIAKEMGTVNTKDEPLVWHKNISVDLYQHMAMWTENLAKPTRLNLDTIRDWIGYPTGEAHTAMYDAYTVKDLFARLQNKQREISLKIKLDKCFETKPLRDDER